MSMDQDTERFFRAVITCLGLSTILGLAVVSALAWWLS
jgi:hypothetical protein